MQLPEKDDYLFFPSQAGELVKISWYQKSQYREAEYYRTPAYVFKTTKDLPDEKTKYETVLFIARERFDDVYYHVPAALSSLSVDHVQKIQLPAPTGESADASKNWIRCKIDQKFFYGQDKIKDPTYRWLVYHPEERQPAQGRFIEARTQFVVGNLISSLPSVQTPVGGLTINCDEATAKNVKSWGVMLFGHKLHRFGQKAVDELELDAVTADKIKAAAKVKSLEGTQLEPVAVQVGSAAFVAGMGIQLPGGK
ncbi:hypothetical protein ACET3X_009529 [Alternaria dauci]|uniref:Uncharacterized protein n=1 Tax=Alternaria dauci TaxID=48095 RepID=A0ABR3U5Y8_9PLEO